MTQIAFLGLGAMGARMAGRLLDAGHTLTVWNRTADRTQPLVARGAVPHATPREAVVGAEVVIAMVRDDSASRYLWTDPDDGAMQAMAQGALAVDCSTLTVDWVRELDRQLAAQDRSFVCAPLAGSRPQAEAGSLIFFVGGDSDAVTRAEPVLLAMGGAVHHAGTAAGSGAAVKLMVNALFGTQVAVAAELLAMGEKLGVPAETAATLLAQTPVMSQAVKGAADTMVVRAFAPQFPIDMVEKDFGYILSSAKSAGATVPVAQAVRSVFQHAKDRGYAESNITGVAQLYSEDRKADIDG